MVSNWVAIIRLRLRTIAEALSQLISPTSISAECASSGSFRYRFTSPHIPACPFHLQCRDILTAKVESSIHTGTIQAFAQEALPFSPSGKFLSNRMKVHSAHMRDGLPQMLQLHYVNWQKETLMNRVMSTLLSLFSSFTQLSCMAYSSCMI